jgi:thiol-disulfide isomerase/thioredoxin
MLRTLPNGFDARGSKTGGPIVVIKRIHHRVRWAVALLLMACCTPVLSAEQHDDDEASPAVEDVVRGLVAAPARSQLDELLAMKIEYVDGICELTDEQKKKAELAGRGDIDHLIDRIEALRKKSPSDESNAHVDDLLRENEALKHLLDGPFEKPSLFSKTLRRLLTAEQLAKLEADEVVFSSAWMTDFDEALELARKHNRPLLVHFHAGWAAPCQQMKVILYKPRVIRFLHDHFVPVFVDVDRDDAKGVMRRYKIGSVPTDLALTPDGDVIDRLQGSRTEQAFMETLRSVPPLARPSGQTQDAAAASQK